MAFGPLRTWKRFDCVRRRRIEWVKRPLILFLLGWIACCGPAFAFAGPADLASLTASAVATTPPLPQKAKPLKVYLLAGQSNMEGHAHVRVLDYMAEDPATKPLWEKMKDKDGNHRMIEDVWISYLTGVRGTIDGDNREVFGQLTAGYGSQVNRDYSQPGQKIGPELAFGITMQEELKQPILIIKTAWGGQSVHTDYRSPSSGPYPINADDIKRGRFETPEQRAELAEKTGKRYRQMVEHVRMVTADIKRVYPDYDASAGFELAGFVWFQGFNDLVARNVYPLQPEGSTQSDYANYTVWFANLICDLRKDLEVPELPVVICVLGVDGPTANPRNLAFRASQAAVAELPEFRDNVIAVPTSPYWDEALGELDQKRQQLRQKRHLLRTKNKNHENADGTLSAEEIEDIIKEMERNLFSEEDLELERRGKSNGGYHYLGSARTYSLVGKAAADALLIHIDSSEK